MEILSAGGATLCVGGTSWVGVAIWVKLDIRVGAAIQVRGANWVSPAIWGHPTNCFDPGPRNPPPPGDPLTPGVTLPTMGDWERCCDLTASPPNSWQYSTLLTRASVQDLGQSGSSVASASGSEPNPVQPEDPQLGPPDPPPPRDTQPSPPVLPLPVPTPAMPTMEDWIDTSGDDVTVLQVRGLAKTDDGTAIAFIGFDPDANSNVYSWNQVEKKWQIESAKRKAT